MPDKPLWERYDPLEGRMLRILDPEGHVTAEEEMPDIPAESVVAAYRLMLLARLADERALSWQRQGRLFTFPPNKGQEAAAVGSAMALEKTDWMVPAFRELGAWLQKGVPLTMFFQLFGGYERGTAFPRELRILPISVPIASQVPHAVGLARAIRQRGEKDAVICYLGDGGTSQGDFHEGLNFAGVWKAPVVFFINNNQYAISVPRSQQTAARTLAQKAAAYGFPGIQVDGNDFFAVYAATLAAMRRARAGEGPALIEAETYRLEAHTTSDDPGRYRSKSEEEEWRAKDPIKRLGIWLRERGLWDDTREEAEAAAAEKAVEAAFAEHERNDAYPLEDVFRHHYAEMPPELVRQMTAHRNYLNWKESR